MRSVTLIVVVLLLSACGRSYSFEDHIDKEKYPHIMEQLVIRIEKRFTGRDTLRQASMDAVWADSCYIHSLTKKEDRYYFLYIQKDVYSPRDDARAVIGSFKMDEKDSLVSVFQDYITFRTKTSIAENNGQLFLQKHVEGQSLSEYINKKGLIQWPNNMVWFNYQTEKWEW